MALSARCLCAFALVAAVSSRRVISSGASGECPMRTVAKWSDVTGCGNNGCAVSVSVPDHGAWSKAVLKIGYKVAPNEAVVLTTLATLGQGGSCEFGGRQGSAADASVPCVKTPNVLGVFGTGRCDSCGIVPEDVQAQMVSIAKATKKTVPLFDGSLSCGAFLMEHLHSDVLKYCLHTGKDAGECKQIGESPVFSRAVVLQVLFAYHVAFKSVGFVHRDVNPDNYALRCVTEWVPNEGCTTPSRGTLVYCYEFGRDDASYCIDLADTEGTVLVLIDFGQSKINRPKVEMIDKKQMAMWARPLGIDLNDCFDCSAADFWKDLVVQAKDTEDDQWSFRREKVDLVPEGALVFGL